MAERAFFIQRGGISPSAEGDQRSTPLDPCRLLQKAGENLQKMNQTLLRIRNIYSSLCFLRYSDGESPVSFLTRLENAPWSL